MLEKIGEGLDLDFVGGIHFKVGLVGEAVRRAGNRSLQIANHERADRALAQFLHERCATMVSCHALTQPIS
jgi:Flp pilus assembly CpaE family ATPase